MKLSFGWPRQPLVVVHLFVASLCTLLLLTSCAPSSNIAASPQSTTGQSTPAQELPDPRALSGRISLPTVPSISGPKTRPAQNLPARTQDIDGNSVTVTDTSRLLALDLYGTLAKTVIALGYGGQLVGRTVSNTEPMLANLPVVTQEGHSLNAEAILALAPTTILYDKSAGPPEVIEQLRQAGITMVKLDGERSPERIADQMRAVASALGASTAGEELVQDFNSRLAAAKEYVGTLVPRDKSTIPSIAFLYVRGKAGVFFILGTNSGAGALISATGAKDVASKAGITDLRPANAEALISLSPDIYLMMTDGLESTGGISGLLARPGVADTPAGAKKRIIDMPDGQILSFGPNYPEVLRQLADAIYKGVGPRDNPDKAGT